MSKRADPIRIYLAQRAGFDRRLVEALGFTAERAQALIKSWEAEAARRGLQPLDNQYWAEAECWILEPRG